MVDLKKKIKRSLLWSYSATIIPQIFQPIITAILARLLLPEDFGLMGMAVVVISFIEIFKDGGLGQTLIQYKDDNEDVANIAFWIQIGLSIIWIVFLWIFTPVISGFVGREELTDILRILSFAFLSSPFINVPLNLMMRRLEFRGIFYKQIGPTLISWAISIIMACFGYGVWALTISYIAGSYLTAITFISNWRPSFCVNIYLVKSIISFGSNVALQGVLTWLNVSLPLLFIGKFQGITALGYLNMAINFSLKPMSFFSIPLVRVMYPTFSELVRQDDILKITYLKALEIICGVGIPSCTAFFFLIPSFVSFILGEKWLAIIPMVRILIVCMILWNLVILNNEVYKSIGIPEIITKIMIVRSLIFVPILFLASRVSIKALLHSFLLSELIFNFTNIYICSRILKFSLREFFATLKIGIYTSIPLMVFGASLEVVGIPEMFNSFAGFMANVSMNVIIFLVSLRFFYHERYTEGLNMVKELLKKSSK